MGGSKRDGGGPPGRRDLSCGGGDRRHDAAGGTAAACSLFGTLEISQLRALAEALPAERRTQLYVAGGCCLVGFGAKAGMFPLHIWLPKAHPVAPAPASALLSGILTKSGVFGVLIISRYLFWADLPWNTVVLALGVVTMVLGAVLAVFSIDLKRTLACSSMSQIGFILVGAAMQGYLSGENALAAWGTVLHMLNHSLIKLVLFVSAGVIYVSTHSLNLNDLRGWGRNKPWLKGVFFVGAASIAGVPGFSGYVSKTLLHESIVEYIHLLEHEGLSATAFQAVEWLFLISGGLTAAYMTKLFVAIFVSPRASGQHLGLREYMSRETSVALGLGAAALLGMGLTPGFTMEPLAERAGTFLMADHGHAVHYFTWVNLKGACISLAIGAVVYLLVIRRLLMRRAGSEMEYLDLLAGLAGPGESGISAGAAGLGLCGSVLRPGGLLCGRSDGSDRGEDPLHPCAGHLCAQAR
ncbi:MAG: proton-conducting transporter membrane subunit [Dysosmobacter sp.]